MKKEIQLEVKNLKEAEELALKELNVSLDEIKIEIIEEKKGVFGIGSKLIVKASTEININVLEETKKYITSILNSLNVEFKMESRKVENELYFNIQSDENPILIGKNGRTLEAIQVLVKNYVNLISDEKNIVSVDIGGYKEKRKHQLEVLATKIAKEVAKTKIPVKLDPMTAYERRIIHTKLSDWRDIYTESEGEGESRVLVIKPKAKN